MDLSAVVFADGVQFTCPAEMLRTGEYAVVVRNLEAFATRYDTNGLRVLGQYTGSFANRGERVELLASAWGPEIACFTLNDGRGWPPAADGAGHSLVPLRYVDQPAWGAGLWGELAPERTYRGISGGGGPHACPAGANQRNRRAHRLLRPAISGA